MVKSKNPPITETHPEVVKQWHPTLNGDKKPEQYSYGSDVYIWWQCAVNIKHIWLCRISHRTCSESDCSYCTGKLVSEDNSLLFLFPNIAKEWHPTLNGNKKPEHFTSASSKTAWFQCSIDPSHKWKSIINNRTKGRGCPICAGKIVSNLNSLEILYPEIAKEWHLLLNDNLFPSQFSYGSHKNIWWQCSIDQNHIWNCSIFNRAIHKSGCPDCFNKNEKLIKEYFDKYQIRHLKQFKVKLEVNAVRSSRVDFFLSELNLFIEYNGRQHYYPVRFSSSQTDEDIEQAFIRQQLRDQQLRDYCQINNINLLEIDGRKCKGAKLTQYLQDYFTSFTIFQHKSG